MRESNRLRKIARVLQAQHDSTCAGFYTPAGRRFGARVRAGVLEFLNWGPDGKPVWTAAPAGPVRDHNGRQLLEVVL
jgi:hypothetical protein